VSDDSVGSDSGVTCFAADLGAWGVLKNYEGGMDDSVNSKFALMLLCVLL